jgi:hypothetical protein
VPEFQFRIACRRTSGGPAAGTVGVAGLPGAARTAALTAAVIVVMIAVMAVMARSAVVIMFMIAVSFCAGAARSPSIRGVPCGSPVRRTRRTLTGSCSPASLLSSPQSSFPHGRVVPPDRYQRAPIREVRIDPGWPPLIYRRRGNQAQRRERVQSPPRHRGTVTGITGRPHFSFAFHVESLNADTAGTTAAARSAGEMLRARFTLDKRPKVFESVGACRRIARYIQTGLKTVNER